MANTDFKLKDYQHAYKLLQETNFDAAPKAKFLYHIVFELTDEARPIFGTTDNLNLSLLSVLARSATLPSYAATVDTINQYNRKKKYQTKIEYKDININFFDDNAGISRSLLEAYYKYYFKEATKNSFSDIPYRDKFSLTLPSYGLDNGRNKPFFEYIKIFQLSKQKWFCYTLVNPIITQWGHDDVSYADGGGIMENKITVGYEAVLYTNGVITPDGDPRGFAEYFYDTEASSLKDPNAINDKEELKPTVDTGAISADFLPTAAREPAPEFPPTPPKPPGFLDDIIIPKTAARSVTDTATASSVDIPRYDSAQLKNIVETNPVILDALTNQALATGSYSGDWNSSNFSEFASLDQNTKNSIQKDIVDQIGTNIKLQQLASRVVNISENTIV